MHALTYWLADKIGNTYTQEQSENARSCKQSVRGLSTLAGISGSVSAHAQAHGEELAAPFSLLLSKCLEDNFNKGLLPIY